jgi:hypothetical protein
MTTMKKMAARLCRTEEREGARSCPHPPSAASPHYATSWSSLQAVTWLQVTKRESTVWESMAWEMGVQAFLPAGVATAGPGVAPVGAVMTEEGRQAGLATTAQAARPRH